MQECRACLFQPCDGATESTLIGMFDETGKSINAVVIGASGGIGGAFVDLLSRDPSIGTVHALSRSGRKLIYPNVLNGIIDIEDEKSIDHAAQVVSDHGDCRLIIVAAGILHSPVSTQGPEKDWRYLDAEWLARVYRTNTIGPMLCAKYFLPLLPKNKKGVFAALSARVGSVSDNQLGGWYGYRASKAALNQAIRTFSIELTRKNNHAICVGLHPGTVDTELSKPFQGAIAPEKLFSPGRSARHMLTVINELSVSDTGHLFAWNGDLITP